MAFGSLSPVAIQQFSDANGNPLAGGKLFFYLAGTTTPTPAYADVGLTTPLANPVILDAAGRAPELFLGAVVYKQVLQNAGGVTIWTADNIITPTALRSTEGASSVTGSQNDVPIPAGIITLLTLTNAAPLTITGFAGGTPGQILIVRPGVGITAPVSLIHNSAASAVGNRLYNYVTSGPTVLAGQSGSAMYVCSQYLGDRLWMLLTHEQGGWVKIPYSAANFQGFTLPSTPVTWTVEPGDVLNQEYYLSGANLMITVALNSTDIAAGANMCRVIGWPYTWNTSAYRLPITLSDTTGAKMGTITAQPGTSVVDCAIAGNATIATGGMHLFGQANLNVQ